MQVAGRLKYFLSAWQAITSDSHILDMVEHCHLEFIENPFQQYPMPPIKFNRHEAAIIDAEIQKLLCKGVLEEAVPSYGQYISTIFLRKKKNGSYRLILNLKGLNASIQYQHFKMESLTCAIQLMKKNCYMASIDLTDAYYTVPVAVEHRKYLRFFWRNTLFQYTCLPNGLASAPRCFTKLLKPVYSTLRSQGYLNVGYIDDSYLQGDSKTDCKNNVLATQTLFESLGFLMNYDKSVLQPCQKLAFLGFILDSIEMKVFLTTEKTEKIILACQQLLKGKPTSIREVAQVIGLLVSALPAVQFGPLFYRSIEIDKNTALQQNKGNYEASMTLSPESISDLRWWVANLPTACKNIVTVNPDIEMETDASLLGWGAVCNGQSAQGMWSPVEKQKHINELELLAAHFGIKSFLPLLKGKHVCIKSDNSTTVCYLNAMGGTKSPPCNTLAKKIWLCCMENDTWLTACHLPGVLNVEADKHSRQFNERTEWQLQPKIFHKITDILGTPEIDLFASRLNNQLPKYVSWKPDPGATHVDAFSFSWSDSFVYIFPPFSLLNRCLQKLEKDQTLALLVAPIWPTQVWWPRLLRLLVATPLMLPQNKDLLMLPHSGAQHPLRNQMRMMACLLSSNLLKQEEYRSQLSDCSWRLGEEVPRNSTRGISKSGQHFVSKGKSIIFNHL